MGGFQSTWYAIRDNVDGSLSSGRVLFTGHWLRVFDVYATEIDVESSGLWQWCMPSNDLEWRSYMEESLLYFKSFFFFFCFWQFFLILDFFPVLEIATVFRKVTRETVAN